MKKLFFLFAIIVLFAGNLFGQGVAVGTGFAQRGGGGTITGITFDGEGIVIGSPADSLIIEIPVSIEATLSVILSTGAEFRISHDATNYANFAVAADGALTIATVDAAAAEADINLNPDGLVGIKTAVPTVELDVTGAIAASTNVNWGGQYQLGEVFEGMPYFRNTTAGDIFFRIQPLDMDGGDNVLMNFDVIGQPGGGDRETLVLGYVAAQTSYQMYSYEAGSGVLRPIQFGHNANPRALIIEIDNDIVMEAGDLTIGVAGSSEITPTLSIIGDADSDAEDTDETFAITITPASDPTDALITATTTQSAGFDFDMPLIASTLTSDVSLSVGAGSPSSAFHIKAIPPGAVGTGPAGQIIIQTPSDDITANVFITGYDSDGSGAPEDQLWYLGSAAASNSDITFVNRQNASLTLGTNDLYRLFLENDGDVQLRKTNATAIVDGTSIAEIQFFGDDDTALADEIVGKIETIATSTWTNGNEDAKMVLNVANNGVLNVNQLVLNTDGSVDVNGAFTASTVTSDAGVAGTIGLFTTSITTGDDVLNNDGVFTVISATGINAIVATGDAVPRITLTNSTGTESGFIEMGTASLKIATSTEDLFIENNEAAGLIQLNMNVDKNSPTGGHVLISTAGANDEMTASSGEQFFLSSRSRVMQTGTASLVDLLVDRLEDDAVASGQDYLMALRLLGSPRFSVQTDGVAIFTAAPVFASYTRHIDLDIGAAVLGPNAPTATTIGTSRGLGFDADNQAIYVEFDIPSDWDGASNMNFNIHWHGTSGDAVANTEKVKWDSHYRSVAIGEAVDNGTLVTATTTFTGGASEGDKETYQTVIVIVYTGGNQPLTAGDILYMQIDRDVTGEAGGGGSYSGLGIITLVELEYTSIANASH